MAFSLSVFNPAFPKDRSKGVALTAEQFAIVHDYIVDRVNHGLKIREDIVLEMLEQANLPVNFPE